MGGRLSEDWWLLVLHCGWAQQSEEPSWEIIPGMPGPQRFQNSMRPAQCPYSWRPLRFGGKHR